MNFRDIGGSDPERTAAPRVEEYVKQHFNVSDPAHIIIYFLEIAS